MTGWNWKERIVAMLAVRDQMFKADADELWEYHFPEVAADMSDISAVQKNLGVSFICDDIEGGRRIWRSDLACGRRNRTL